MSTNLKIDRAKSVQEVLNTKYKSVPFDGKWKQMLGEPELAGTWIIWGESGHGKTRFTLQLCKYLTNFAKVAYNPLEEGISLSFKKALVESGMQNTRNFIVLNQEDIPTIKERLSKRKSPDVVVIDSLQYSGLNYTAYKQLRAEFPKKLFIFISHAEGKLPEGRVAKKVRYDAFIKIRVEGYKAFPTSRYGGGEAFVVWNKGAEDYWSKISENKKSKIA